jgi:hypothetical protein
MFLLWTWRLKNIGCFWISKYNTHQHGKQCNKDLNSRYHILTMLLKVGSMLNDVFNIHENPSLLLHLTHNMHKVSKLSIWLVYYFRLQPCSRVLQWFKDSELQTAVSGASAHRQNSVLYWQ